MPISAHRALRTTARGLIAALFLLAFGQAEAQALVKVNDNINFKVGLLLQPELDFQEVPNTTNNGTGGFQENMYLRRVRFLIGGQVAKNVFFFAETDNSNLGKSTQPVGGAQTAKSPGTGFILLDAVAEWRIAKEFNIQVGEIRPPISREGLKSSATQFMLDLSAYAFPTSAALQNQAGERDTGAMLRGYFLCDRLEYRAGVFSGFRAPGVKNEPRFTGRLQYDFFDTEVYNFVSYPGTYLGTKKILAIGGAYDTQNDFRYASADMYVDWPIPLGSFESTIQYQYINGGATFAALPQQNLFQIEGGVYLKGLGIAPIARFEQKTFTNPNTSLTLPAPVNKNEDRVAIGLNFYPIRKAENNFNIRTWWQRVHVKPGYATNEFTVQMRVYYF